MDTAYAVRTGIGAVGTFVVGILLFREAVKLEFCFYIGLIVVGHCWQTQAAGPFGNARTLDSWQ